MRVLKYFYEEPASLEAVGDEGASARAVQGTSDDAPRMTLEAFLAGPQTYRGYLAGTDTNLEKTGASCLLDDLVAVLRWMLPSPLVRFDLDDSGRAVSRTSTRNEDLRDALGFPGTAMMITAGAAADSLMHWAGAVMSREDRRDAIAPLKKLLTAGAIVLLPDPAPNGVDWSLFSGRPLAADMAEAMEATRIRSAAFVIPFAEARGEHRFYFERYDLSLYKRYRIR